MDSLLSFPVGLFHPLQHAGLSRRSPSGRPSFPYRLENVATDELKELHSQREERPKTEFLVCTTHRLAISPTNPQR